MKTLLKINLIILILTAYSFKVLDMRGLVPEGLGGGADVSIGGDFTVQNLPPFDHPDPVIATVSNIDTLTLNAAPQQITSQRSIGVEVSRDGAAPAFVTVTVNANNTTA